MVEHVMWEVHKGHVAGLGSDGNSVANISDFEQNFSSQIPVQNFNRNILWSAIST
jgi:hypothetical protein